MKLIDGRKLLFSNGWDVRENGVLIASFVEKKYAKIFIEATKQFKKTKIDHEEKTYGSENS